MRLSLAMACAASVVVLTLASAAAAPLVSMPSIQRAAPAGDDADLLLVRGGCGFGAHRGYYGHCRYNRGWRGHLRARRDYWRRHY